MLWKQLNPRYRKLLRGGRQGQAVVVRSEADEARDDARDDRFGIFGWNVTIRVKYPEGDTADFDRYVEAKYADAITTGMTLPIRFDPGKRSRVEIDTEALRVQRDEDAARAHNARDAVVEQAVERAESQLEPLDSNPPSAYE
jgi:hypothetical protein